MKTNAQALANAIQAQRNCEKSCNSLWHERWRMYIDAIMATAPSGSGIDCGTKLGWCADSNGVAYMTFDMDYHHINDGMYDGWTEHRLNVRPDWTGIRISNITGMDRNEIKDYLAEVLVGWLDSECEVNI